MPGCSLHRFLNWTSKGDSWHEWVPVLPCAVRVAQPAGSLLQLLPLCQAEDAQQHGEAAEQHCRPCKRCTVPPARNCLLTNTAVMAVRENQWLEVARSNIWWAVNQYRCLEWCAASSLCSDGLNMGVSAGELIETRGCGYAACCVGAAIESGLRTFTCWCDTSQLRAGVAFALDFPAQSVHICTDRRDFVPCGEDWRLTWGLFLQNSPGSTLQPLASCSKPSVALSPGDLLACSVWRVVLPEQHFRSVCFRFCT